MEDIGLEEPNPLTRRYLHWAVGQSDLPAGSKTFLQAVLLRMSAEGASSTASYSRLALDASISIASVYRLVKLTEGQGFLRRRPAGEFLEPRLDEDINPYDPQFAKELLLRERRYQKRKGQATRLRVIAPPEILDRTTPLLRHLWHLPPTERSSEEEWEKWQLDNMESGDWKLFSSPEIKRRFIWERSIRDSPLQASAKGTAWALALLLNSEGRSFRRYLTLADLTLLSGYDRGTIQRRLRELEALGWLTIRWKRGRGGGLTPRLHFPADIIKSLLEREDDPDD